jgi:hypothetical protein
VTREDWLDAIGSQERKVAEAAALLVALETPPQRKRSEREVRVLNATMQGRWKPRLRWGTVGGAA